MRLSVVPDFERGDLEMNTQLDEYSPTFNLEYEPRDYCSDTMRSIPIHILLTLLGLLLRSLLQNISFKKPYLWIIYGVSS